MQRVPYGPFLVMVGMVLVVLAEHDSWPLVAAAPAAGLAAAAYAVWSLTR